MPPDVKHKVFDLAYVRRNNQSEDLLVLSYSKNCGSTWQIRESWTTDELITNDGSSVFSSFVPNFNEWQEREINIQSAAGEENVIIRFELSGDKGNYLYIDNVRLFGQWIELTEEQYSEEKYLVKIVDLLGRNIKPQNLFFEIYSDGSVIKKHHIRR